MGLNRIRKKKKKCERSHDKCESHVVLCVLWLCLVQAWDYVMAFWLEAIRTEVPQDERQELKVLMW